LGITLGKLADWEKAILAMSDSTKPAGDPFALQPEAVEVPAVEAVGPQPQPVTTWSVVRELVETVVLSLIIFLLIRQVVQNYRIENHSMEPNFYEGQFVLVNKLAYRLGQPERGDVLVFHNPGNTNEDYIKRIIGLPGDTVKISQGKVYVNGALLPEPYLPDYLYTEPELEKVVRADELFVVGDNRPNSNDSRFFGPVPHDNVIGKSQARLTGAAYGWIAQPAY